MVVGRSNVGVAATSQVRDSPEFDSRRMVHGRLVCDEGRGVVTSGLKEVVPPLGAMAGSAVPGAVADVGGEGQESFHPCDAVWLWPW